MKNKVLVGLIASATIGSAVISPTMINQSNTQGHINKVLMVNNTRNSSVTNEAVVINGNSNLNLYALSNGKGIVSYLSTGEMLTLLGNPQGSYCKVRVQETGAIGYINISNMQNIINGTNSELVQQSGSGQVINVTTRLRLRSNPSINANVNSYLTNGTQFNILGKQGQWYKISVNDQTGFVYEEYVSTNTTNNINTSDSSSKSSNSNNTINKVANNTTDLGSSKNNKVKKVTDSKIISNNNTSKSVPIYGQKIPGTNQTSYNVIVENQGKRNATILPEKAGSFTNRIFPTGGAYFTNVEIAQNTYYTKISGQNNVYDYYIVSPQLINTEHLKVGANIDPATLTITNPTKNIKSIRAVGYLSNGLIVGIDSAGKQVYLPSSSLKKTIKFSPVQVNVMLKNATINTKSTVPVYQSPVSIESLSTIKSISNKNLNVVLMAQTNGYSEIIFGTEAGIFEGWVPTQYLSIS